MPALLTHRLFGEQALINDAVMSTLGIDGAEFISAPSDEKDAFLIANQGPDPLFFAFKNPRASVFHETATRMHNEHDGRTLAAMRDAVTLLGESDRRIGRFFAAGQLAHYVLDRTAHPYIFAQQYELMRASDELDAASHELHALIESDIDSAMLKRLRGVSTAEFPPVLALACSDRVKRVGGELFAQAAFQSMGVDLRPADYGHAVGDMTTCYRVIEPADSNSTRALGVAERRIRDHSELMALAHRADTELDCPAMNPHGNPWTSPFTGAFSTERFDELFDRALATFSELVEPFLDGADMDGITGGLDYSGAPVHPAQRNQQA
jgi:hypothetical protein